MRFKMTRDDWNDLHPGDKVTAQNGRVWRVTRSWVIGSTAGGIEVLHDFEVVR